MELTIITISQLPYRAPFTCCTQRKPKHGTTLNKQAQRPVNTDRTFAHSLPVALAAAAGAGNALLSSVYPNPFRAALA